MPNQNDYAPIFEYTRGGTPESLHYGAIAIVNAQGDLLAGVGSPDTVSFMRSSAKPFQAIPFIEQDGHHHFGLSKKQIALICASHSGTRKHVRELQKLLRKVGLQKTMLQCGVHYPFHAKSAEKMRAKNTEPSVYHHNCSGKHSGMLAFARLRDWPLTHYLDADHPVQAAILEAIAAMCDLRSTDIKIGIDGCSAPNFAAPLHNVALGFARLSDPTGLPKARAKACTTIFKAMTRYPRMVAGPKRFDSCLMRVTKGRILAKSGAEGYLGMAVSPGAIEAGSPAMGIAMKISDGDASNRARGAVALEVLKQLGALKAEEVTDLQTLGPNRKVNNWRKRIVGEGHPVFSLQAVARS